MVTGSNRRAITTLGGKGFSSRRSNLAASVRGWKRLNDTLPVIDAPDELATASDTMSKRTHGFAHRPVGESRNPRASAFDLLRLSGADTTGWPYRWRRAALESVFTARRLSVPWTLCPSTTDPDVVREWLTWASVGMEGVVFKKLDDAYLPSVRGWQKYKVRETTEAIVGAVTGSGRSPEAAARQVRHRRPPSVGRTTTLSQAAGAAVVGLLALRRRGHPWTGWSFSTGWDSRERLIVTLVEAELVVEVGVDVPRDASGRWRHAASWHRARPGPRDVPRLTSPSR